MFSSFTATIGEVVIEWTPEAPYLTGNGPAIEAILKEINSDAIISLTPTGPLVVSIETDAAVVFTVINNLFGSQVVYENPPEISKLWEEFPLLPFEEENVY